ncbi:MAG: hypothetical protein WC313_00815 [Candidatus Kapaibacterium sp.]|jgi:hypothetical protein|nr:hypothetical protein [Candidatus Kapabacteria bacterium]
MKKFTIIIFILLITLWACDENVSGPNEIGGSTDVEFTKVGSKTAASISINDEIIQVDDSIVVIKNDGGIVSTFVKFTFDYSIVKYFDTLAGTHELDIDAKHLIMDTYLEKFGATLDTTDKNAVTLSLELKTKVTTEGIQDFIYSGGDLTKPFTVVKYSSGLGDKYEFTDKDNVKITRTVVYKSETDDYPLAFWNIKVIKVEETKDDPILDKISYIANHKFGPIAIEIKFKNNNSLKIGFLPPNL